MSDLKEQDETAEILSDADSLKRLAASDAELARGEAETEQQLGEAMRRRRASA